MMYPWLKLTAKLVHEKDYINCTRSGRYNIVFSNKHSWFSRRTVDISVHITEMEGNSKRVHLDELLSPPIA
ncbi:hypothetical protein KIN20_021312 [Parelaphostrongylus tenuis]|uniref:Uncharacterized protein n=1 Tax=Parelaphostrongylus tenuis TaxID=148309 RepID=A0AAD5N538_PARTN|nr:hypothetical protein KIN20_021312 [Parelaphostrongylus tenuis]